MTGTESRQGSRLRMIVFGAAGAALLAIPAVAMLYTREVDWTALDFVFAAVMIATLFGVIELVVRRAGSAVVKLAAIWAALLMFALVWANVAVGIIGPVSDPRGWIAVAVGALVLGGMVSATARLTR